MKKNNIWTKRIGAVLLAAALATGFAACGAKNETTPAPAATAAVSATPAATVAPATPAAAKTVYPLTLKDSYDRDVVIEKEPQKVISIAPNITETVFVLDKGAVLKGRTDYCDFPEQAKAAESIGSLTKPNIEKIVSMQPDLVIASTHFPKEALKKLEEAKVKVVVLYGAESFDGVYQTITKVGLALNAQDKATQVVADMKKKVQEVADKVKAATAKPKVYYVVGYGKSGDFTATGETFLNSMITMAGGENIAADAKGWKYSLEKITEKNPDIMICTKNYDTKKGIAATAGYKDLPVVKNGKLMEIDNNLLDRQGPRQAEGLQELAKLIHPELFK